MFVSLRTATEKDTQSLNEIDGSIEWKGWIHPTAAKEGRVIIAEVDSVPVGYLRYGSFLWDDRAPFIQMIQVAEQYRRRGIASALIERVLETAQELRLEHLYVGVYSSTDESNEASIALHEKLGFTAVGTIQIPDQPKAEILYFKPLD